MLILYEYVAWENPILIWGHKVNRREKKGNWILCLRMILFLIQNSCREISNIKSPSLMSAKVSLVVVLWNGGTY